MRCQLVIIHLLVFCGLICSLPSIASDQQHRFHVVSTSGDEGSPNGKSVRAFSERVAQKSDGRIHINVFYQNELGGQNELYDQLLKGNVHFMLEWPLTSYDQRLALGLLPYLVLGWDDAIEAYLDGGWLAKLFGPIFAENGLKYFGPYPEGFGGVATRGAYATNKEQAQGIKVRSQTIFPLPQTVQAMGFEAVPIDWSEVYTSIQTGVVDGDSGNVIYWDYKYFADVLDYYVHSKQNFAASVFVMNLEAWQSLDAEDQAIIAEAAQWMIDKQFVDARTTDEHWIETAQNDGLEYIEPSAEEVRVWVDQVREQVWPLAEKAYGKEIMDIVRTNASVPK